MMDHMTYATKSPEKSSPSFPEDVEDDDEDPVDLGHLNYSNSTQKKCDPSTDSELQTDVAMLAEDEDDDVGQTRSFMLGVDSPHHPADSSEKKVHWSNQNVQVLLDCVERHLDEFNVQKKHKQVWQTIGTEMEPFGFTMEHCYNKWKNLRRDVRLLVNNPQKAVRNADILRRVARLILVIYPNIDATTMQVTGDRIGGGKSTPNTPGGPASMPCRVTLSNAHHAPDSPLYFGIARAGTPQSLTPGFHTFTPNGIKHKSDQTIYETSVPGTALFTNSNQDNDKPNTTNHNGNSNNHSENGSVGDLNSNNPNSNFPFFFNPAAAALLVQSQLFNDLLRQQQQQQQHQQSASEESPQLDSVQQREQLLASSNGTKVTPCNTNNTNNPVSNVLNGDCLHDNELRQSVTLASVLLNGLPNVDLSQLPGLTISSESPMNTSAVDRLPPGSELAGVVERLRNEETVHLRLADMVTHLADELRAAGMRRRATLDQLLEIMQGSRIPTMLGQTAKATDASHRV